MQTRRHNLTCFFHIITTFDDFFWRKEIPWKTTTSSLMVPSNRHIWCILLYADAIFIFASSLRVIFNFPWCFPTVEIILRSVLKKVELFFFRPSTVITILYFFLEGKTADCRVLCFNFIYNCITFFSVLVFLNTNLSIFFEAFCKGVSKWM